MRHALPIIGLLLLAGGCGGPADKADSQQPAAEVYGSLPGLKASEDQPLRDELARIIEEGGTPEQLDTAQLDSGRIASRPIDDKPIDDEDNVAAGLVGLFPAEQIDAILAQSESLFPPKQFSLDPIQLQRAIDFRRRYEPQRLRAREALKRPRCDFGVSLAAGLSDWTFIDVVEICGRLEAFRVAESLADGRTDEAIESLAAMLRLATCLGAEKLVPARLQAAFLRTEAFRVLLAIVGDDRLTRANLDRLRTLVETQRAAWPGDADAWIGDRALGLVAYEQVRAGQLEELLSDQEIAQFKKEGSFEELLAAAVRDVDGDERYYLDAMRKIIASCSRPFYARRDLFDTLGVDLQQKRNTPEFPMVAVWVLGLTDVREAHVIQAHDRANWDAWALALALATGHEPPAERVNPLTGREYRVVRTDGTIEVTGFGSGDDGDNPSIVVRDFGARD